MDGQERNKRMEIVVLRKGERWKMEAELPADAEEREAVALLIARRAAELIRTGNRGAWEA